MKYRPWGPIDWALELSDVAVWDFVGVIGTEERSLCSWSYLKPSGLVRNELFAEIHDIDSEKYGQRSRDALDVRRNEFYQLGGAATSIERFDIMAELFLINDFAQRVSNLGPSLILDVTSFPKRFFFNILKTLVNNPVIQNLFITYTSPADYAPNNEPLYEDQIHWTTIPGFGGSGATEVLWIVSVGFLVDSLQRYVVDNPMERMKILVPFPAPLSARRKTVEALASLEEGYEGRFEKFRIEPHDMSTAFDRISILAGKYSSELAFAPFGPKPISAAMCLYAIQKNSSVHYQQPTVYHPEYSRGILNNDPKAAITGYWVKHKGENLYSL